MGMLTQNMWTWGEKINSWEENGKRKEQNFWKAKISADRHRTFQGTLTRSKSSEKSEQLNQTWKMKEWTHRRYRQEADSGREKYEIGTMQNIVFAATFFWGAETDVHFSYGKESCEIFPGIGVIPIVPD